MKDKFVVAAFGKSKFCLKSLGKQGCGKSSLLNGLLGEEQYQTGIKLEMKNFVECQLNHLKTGNFFGDKTLQGLTTIDTPGFLDNVEELNSSGALIPCFQMFVKDLIVRGPNAFILVMNINEYTKTEFSFFKRNGSHFWKRILGSSCCRFDTL
jgi:GTPase SAR1 family protein